MDIAIVVYDGFDELDAIGPFEVFQNAANAGAECTTTLTSLEGRSPVTASHGLRIEVDDALANLDPDLLLVPGGGWNDRGDRGAWAEAEAGTLPAAIDESHENGVTIAGVCTGGMLLARAGVLDGRSAVTHAGALEELRETAAEVVDARVVDAGDVLTAGGVTSGLDLAFHLVERTFGADIAEQVSIEMEYTPRGPVHRD